MMSGFQYQRICIATIVDEPTSRRAENWVCSTNVGMVKLHSKLVTQVLPRTKSLKPNDPMEIGKMYVEGRKSFLEVRQTLL